MLHAPANESVVGPQVVTRLHLRDVHRDIRGVLDRRADHVVHEHRVRKIDDVVGPVGTDHLDGQGLGLDPAQLGDVRVGGGLDPEDVGVAGDLHEHRAWLHRHGDAQRDGFHLRVGDVHDRYQAVLVGEVVGELGERVALALLADVERLGVEVGTDVGQLLLGLCRVDRLVDLLLRHDHVDVDIDHGRRLLLVAGGREDENDDGGDGTQCSSRSEGKF